jgi:glyoxylase-like metal-dependent hydrolase (beta-lactamase superfamily II)
MPRFSTHLPIILFASLTLPLLAQTPLKPRDPIVLPETTKQISLHVYAIPDTDTTQGLPNIGIIVGSRAALVVDTGMGNPNGALVYSEAQKLAPNHQLYLVTTHIHPEHDLGANAFPPSTKMIRSTDEEKDIAQSGLNTAQAFASRNAVNANLLKDAAFRKADITFDREYSLDLGGGVTVRIIAVGPDHTLGDTVIFVSPDSVLFSGDTAMRGQPAFTGPQSSLNHWLGTLDLLDSLHPKIVVPSHGPIGDAAFISGYRTYLTHIRDRATALKHEGKNVDEAVATITAEMKPEYPDTGRLAGAIRVAYKEAP